MAYLLDVNLLIALAWPSHVNHHDAHLWFSKNAHAGWATCPLTQCGFVRISSNPKIIPDAVTPKEALKALREMTTHQYHRFWPDDVNLTDVGMTYSDIMLNGHRQVTDAYLLSLAIRHKGKLATFDKNIINLGSPESIYRKYVILLTT